MITHDFPQRIYYDDTDAGGVVYHGNYFKFTERARTEYLRALGFENSALRRTHNIIIVVKTIEAEYFSPARLDDFLTIQTRLLSVKNTSFVMEQKAYRGDDCIFSSQVVLVCVDVDTGRPSKIPDDVKKSFEERGS